jgi:hypothetical protein
MISASLACTATPSNLSQFYTVFHFYLLRFYFCNGMSCENARRKVGYHQSVCGWRLPNQATPTCVDPTILVFPVFAVLTKAFYMLKGFEQVLIP